MKNNDVLLTSSDNYSQEEITSHLGIVDSQIVIGANIFRDVFAGFRDLFGGETKGYKKDLDKMKKAAFDSIKNETLERGGNAIISLRIDLDEISGGNKSMFMINVYGSAVKLKDSVFNSNDEIELDDEISRDELIYYERRNELKKKLAETDNLPRNIDINDISEYDLWTKEISMKILESYNIASQRLKDNLSEIPIPYLEDFLKRNIEEIDPEFWDSLILNLEKRDWFNYNFICDFLKSEKHIRRFRGLRFCLIRKDIYKSGEAGKLKDLGNYILSDFSTQIEKKTIDKMIGTKEVYICPYCLKETKVGENCGCGRNKFGFKKHYRKPESIGNKLISLSKALEAAFSDDK